MVRAVAIASSQFRSKVRHPVTLVVGDDIRLDGTTSTTLLLPASPVVAVITVEVTGQPVTDYTWSRAGMLERPQGWTRALGAVRVVYTHGWATIPDDISDAVFVQAQHLLTVEPGVASMQVGGESLTFAPATGPMPVGWTTAVANYRINQGDRA